LACHSAVRSERKVFFLEKKPQKTLGMRDSARTCAKAEREAAIIPPDAMVQAAQ
jgi:hypothetical protein